jgi:hypothetical protein
VTLQGLPDFQQPIGGEGFQIFYPYEQTGNFLLVPDQLVVAEREDGSQDFLLELVRGRDPLLPPPPYGLLDFRLRAGYRSDEALVALRNQHASATVQPIVFSSGFLRIRLVGDNNGTARDLSVPVPLAWNGLGIARSILRLSQSSASLLKKSLVEAELLALHTSAELEIVGVSPRHPIRIRFDPVQLLGSLSSLGDDKRQVPWAKVLDFFRRDPSSLPLSVMGDTDRLGPDEFAEAVADRVRMRFGTFIPAPEERAQPYMVLTAPEEFGSGSFEWDLAEAVPVGRVIVLDLDPFDAARQLVRVRGLEAVFHETVVPPLTLGAVSVSISANLPVECLGLIALGVTIRVPPRPPHRVEAVVTSAELNPPVDRATIRLRLSPVEKLEYTFSTFAVVKDSTGIEQLSGAETPHSGDRLDLGVDDFPLDFVPIIAQPELLAVASIQGTCRWPEREGEVVVPFELSSERPAISIVLAKGTTGAMLEVAAQALDGSKTLKLGPLPAKPLHIGLHSFPGYGPHKIEIECTFREEAGTLFAIDLLPEGRPDTLDEITTLAFTPAQPTREWSWLAQSPFWAGYQYRRHSGVGEIPEPWSEAQSPFDTLTVSAEHLEQ